MESDAERAHRRTQRAAASRAWPFVPFAQAIPGDITQHPCDQCGELNATWEIVAGNNAVFTGVTDMMTVAHHLMARLFGNQHRYCPIADDWKLVRGSQIRTTGVAQ